MQASGCGQNLVEVRAQENLAAAEGQKQRPRACQIIQHLEALGGGQFPVVVMIEITMHAALVAAVGQVEMHAERPVLFDGARSEEHTSELQSQSNLVCRLLLEQKK